MARIEIYTTPFCGPCRRVQRLFDEKGVAYELVNIQTSSAARARMRARTGGRTDVPQVVVDDRPLGGVSDVLRLEGRGELDALLTGNTPR